MKTKIMLAGFLITAGTAWSQTSYITIPNFSFEGYTKSITSSSTIGTWNVSASATFGGASLSVGTANSFGLPAAPHGTNIVQLTMPGLVLSSVDLNQTLTTPFLVNSVYTLTFSLYRPATLDFTTLNLNSGSTTVASMSTSQLTSMTMANMYSLVTLVYTNTANTGNIGIDFNDAHTSGSAFSMYVDNFTLAQSPISTTPTPEPTTLTLLGLGAAALTYNIRRNKLGRMKTLIRTPTR